MTRPSFPRFIAVGVLALGLLVTAAAPASASSRAADPAPTRAGTVLDGPAGSVLSVRGAGPFRIGAHLQALQEAGLIDWVAPPLECDVVYTGVTGEWSGALI